MTMALELGVDRKQIEALKAVYRRWTGDPVQFRFLATLVIMGAIIALVEMPLAARLDSARARHKEALALSSLSQEVRGFVEQVEAYDPKVAVSAEIVDWQNYVLSLLSYSNATLISIEPKAVEPKGAFQVVQMELVARGSSYREFVDFIDRLEHGERLMRVEKVRVEKHQTSMYLTCMIRGLVKSSAASESKPASDGHTGDDKTGDDKTGDDKGGDDKGGDGEAGEAGIEAGDASGGSADRADEVGPRDAPGDDAGSGDR